MQLPRSIAHPSLDMERVVQALDAAQQREGKVLHAYLLVGRFELPKGAWKPPRN